MNIFLLFLLLKFILFYWKYIFFQTVDSYIIVADEDIGQTNSPTIIPDLY